MSESGFYLLFTNKLHNKEKTFELKNFPAGYVGSFYRNLSDNVDNFLGSDFYSRITADADIRKEDVQKYILTTSDFAKSMQTDINHYVTRDRINDASFRQKLDPISKNILRRQNPLELVFEDISTFDAENPIVGSLLREIELKKKQTDSDFIKSIPSHPGKEFEIKKRLDKLRGLNENDNIYNNKNNNFNFGSGGEPPSLPNIEDFLDGGTRPPQHSPPPPPSINGNLFNTSNAFIPPPTDDFNINNRKAPPTIWKNDVGNNLLGLQAMMKGPRENEKTETQKDIDDFLYKLPEKKMSELEFGDGLLKSLGTSAKTIFDDSIPTQNIFDEYNIEDIKNTMDEKGEIPESIYIFYGRESEQFVQALEFIGLSPINREFAAFLLSDLVLKTMTQNKLSIHVESGEIFYDNHNTGENFYNFLLS